uniref:G protein-coupled receptor 35 n=1 Tax=Canis lupus familiaris TaxID=9615 RepID=A0A8I3Q536_CANLF
MVRALSRSRASGLEEPGRGGGGSPSEEGQPVAGREAARGGSHLRGPARLASAASAPRSPVSGACGLPAGCWPRTQGTPPHGCWGPSRGEAPLCLGLWPCCPGLFLEDSVSPSVPALWAGRPRWPPLPFSEAPPGSPELPRRQPQHPLCSCQPACCLRGAVVQGAPRSHPRQQRCPGRELSCRTGATIATEAMSANGTCARPHPTWVENVDRTYTGALLVLGLLLNGLALWVLCCRMRPWTETRVYMVNLAAADLCLLCALPFFLHSLKDTTDTVSCQLSQGIYLANRYLSIGLITAIAVDRYVAVRHPLCARGLRSPRQAAAVCAALWVLVGSSLVLRWALGVQEGGFCFRNPARQSAGTTLFSLLGFYPPLAVLGFCSLQVVAALAERPASGPHQAQATRRATRMVWANLAVFVLCFLPFHVVLTVYAAAGRPTPALCYALYVTGKLSDANCCLDAIGYYFVAKEFQEATLLASVPVAKAHRTQDSLSVTLA